MKPKNLLMLGVGAVVLYFVWQKFGMNSSGDSNGENGENKAGARGKVGSTRRSGGLCYCAGSMYPRSCSPWHTCAQCCPQDS